MGDYAQALAAGIDADPPERKAAIAQKLHDYTGLPVDYLRRANLRVNGGEFEKTLQGEPRLTTGRLDTRFSGPTDRSDEQGSRLRSAIGGDQLGLRLGVQRLRAHALKFGQGQTYKPEIERRVRPGMFEHISRPAPT